VGYNKLRPCLFFIPISPITMPRFIFTVLSLLLITILPAFVNGQQPQPSVTPTCFACPPVDLAGRLLIATSDSNSELKCSYETIPNDFFCKYFLNTGLRKQDKDDGKCPLTAIITTCMRKRGTPEIMRERRAKARAARPQSSNPQFMAVRGTLRKNKRNNHNAQ